MNPAGSCPHRVLSVAFLLAVGGCSSQYVVPGQDRYAAAANPPPIRGEEIADFDPSHVRLRDGRIYRLSGFTDYDRGAPEFAWHRNRLSRFLDRARKDGRPLGLRPVSDPNSPHGEAVEFWSYPAPLFLCGSSTKEEIRRIQRRWYTIQDEVLFEVENRRTGQLAQ